MPSSYVDLSLSFKNKNILQVFCSVVLTRDWPAYRRMSTPMFVKCVGDNLTCFLDEAIEGFKVK